MKDNLPAALALAERHWRIFPIHSPNGDACDCNKADCGSPAKHPRTAHGLLDATTDIDRITRWWTQWPHAGIAVATGPDSNIVVIDVDPRHGGDVQLIELTEQNELLPAGPAVATGGGGWHYYFEYPAETRVQSRNGQIAPGIDVKADGGYVIAPPSVHITGVSYEWLEHSDLRPPPLPAWLLTLATARSKGTGDGSAEPSAVPADVAPGSRNSTLASWGGRLRQYGASQSVIFASLMAINAEWTEPLDRTEVAQIAASQARYEPEAAFPVVGSSKKQKVEAYVPEPFSAASLRHEVIAPMRWAVPGLIAEGLGVMAGRAKLGKSFKMLAISIAVAEGGIALGEIPVEDGDVLYLALEDNKRRLQKRLGTMIPEGDGWPERLFIETQWPRSEQGGIDALKAFIGQHPHLRLITIDTIARFRTMPQGRGRANAYQEDYEFAAELQRLALDNAIAIVVVTHLNKTLHDDYIDKISGSVGLPGAADTIMYLDRARGTGGQKEARLRVTGRDIEEQDYRVAFDGEHCLWTIVGEWEGEQKSSERAELLAVMAKIGNPVTPEDIAAAMGKTRPGAYKALYRAALDGDVISHKGKLFTLKTSTFEEELSLQSTVRLSAKPPIDGQKDTKDTDNADSTFENSFKLDDSAPMDSRARGLGLEAQPIDIEALPPSPNGMGHEDAAANERREAARHPPLPPNIAGKACPLCKTVTWRKTAAGAWLCGTCRPSVVDIRTGKAVS